MILPIIASLLLVVPLLVLARARPGWRLTATTMGAVVVALYAQLLFVQNAVFSAGVDDVRARGYVRAALFFEGLWVSSTIVVVVCLLLVWKWRNRALVTRPDR